MYRESRLRKSGRRHKEAVQSLDGVQAPVLSPSGLPQDYPARPTPDAVCGYVGGLGPFYTRTTQEARAAFDADTTLGSSSFGGGDGVGGSSSSASRARRRRVRFGESVVVDQRTDIKRKWIREGEVHSWHPLSSGSRRFYESVWICVSLGALFLSTLLLMVSFVTNSWGVVTVPWPPGSIGQGSRIWHFGLWQCCRDDGLCLGLKWPAFYTATRTFAVLSLFAHALTFAWMLGHTLEKLLNYESCTMLTLISNCFITSSFSLIAVVCFGVIWPIEFSQMYPNTTNHLSYSYYLAVATVPLTSISGACALVDFKGAWKVYEIREQFGVEEEVVEEEEEEEEEANEENRDSANDEGEEVNGDLQEAELRRLRRCTTV